MRSQGYSRPWRDGGMTGGLSSILAAPDGRRTMVERIILALRSDFGCLVIIVAFVVIMISTIVFADIITPPSNNPFV
jgi:hypothetical protein